MKWLQHFPVLIKNINLRSTIDKWYCEDQFKSDTIVKYLLVTIFYVFLGLIAGYLATQLGIVFQIILSVLAIIAVIYLLFL